MKAIVSTDWHLGYPITDDRIIKTLNSFVDQIEERKPDLFIHCGDVVHSKKPSGDIIEYITQIFTRISAICPIVIIKGNHDEDRAKGFTALDFLDDMGGNITYVRDRPLTDGVVGFFPYERVLSPQTVAEAQNCQLVFLHQGVDIASMTKDRFYGERKDAFKAEDLQGIPLVVTGHIHYPTLIQEEDYRLNVAIIGSPYQLNYADPILTRNFIEVDLDNYTYTPIAYRDSFILQQVTIEIDDYDSELAVQKLPAFHDNTYYKIHIAVTQPFNQKKANKVRTQIEKIFGKNIDELYVISVLANDTKNTLSSIRRTLQRSQMEGKTDPVDMVIAYLKSKGGAFFQAQPELLVSIENEMMQIVDQVSRG